MTTEERDVIILQRRTLLDNLATIYPSPMVGGSLFNTVLDVYPDTYTRHRCMRDLIYLEEKGYVCRRKKGFRDDPQRGEWQTTYWAITAAGMDVNQMVREDLTLEI